MYNAASLGSTGKKSDPVEIKGPLLRQLRWWCSSLSSAKFVGSRVWGGGESPSTTLLRSDASGEDGWGACVGGLHLVGPWPVDLMDAHMLFKELVPVVISISLLAMVLPESVFGVAVDNTGAAFAVNKMSCRDAIARRLIQQLSSGLEWAGHTALAAHVRRDRNTHADALSHTLPPSLWLLIMQHQDSRISKGDAHAWRFPFVVQCLATGVCKSGLFKLTKSLFSRRV